jgi:Fe-S-cluster-containing hydrogenase component 2
MAVRKIIEIDDEKCDGCGLCITACAEGALRLIDGKARVVSDTFCDGLGACIGECPQGALRIVEREASKFDLTAVEAHLAAQQQPTPQPLTIITAAAPARPCASSPPNHPFSSGTSTPVLHPRGSVSGRCS